MQHACGCNANFRFQISDSKFEKRTVQRGAKKFAKKQQTMSLQCGALTAG
jgi:hypothetical protein